MFIVKQGSGPREGNGFSVNKNQTRRLKSRAKPSILEDKVRQTRPSLKKKKKKERKKEKKEKEKRGIKKRKNEGKKKISAWRMSRNSYPPLSNKRFIKNALPIPHLLCACPTNSLLHYLTFEQKIVRNIWKRNNVAVSCKKREI